MKRMRQDVVKRTRNNTYRDSLRQEVKSLKALVSSGDKKKAAEKLRGAYSEIDKSYKKKLMHKNTAARKKSALSQLVAGMPTAKRAKSTSPTGKTPVKTIKKTKNS